MVFNVNQDTASRLVYNRLTTSSMRTKDIKPLLEAKLISLEQALRAKEKGYRNETERYDAEAAFCRDYFKCAQLTALEADIWCNPATRKAADTQEQLVAILRLDANIPDVAKKYTILTTAGINLNLFKRQQLNQEMIRTLRDAVASQCTELVALGFLKERYSKADKIPEKTPIKFIKEVLKRWGFLVDTVKTGNQHPEWRLNLDITTPLSRRLNLDIRTDKEKRRDQAMILRNKGMSYGLIAKELGLTKRQVQLLLKPTVICDVNQETVKRPVYQMPMTLAICAQDTEPSLVVKPTLLKQSWPIRKRVYRNKVERYCAKAAFWSRFF